MLYAYLPCVLTWASPWVASMEWSAKDIALVLAAGVALAIQSLGW